MKIGIDGTALAIPYSCGTKTYAVNLLQALGEIDTKNDYTIYCPVKVSFPFANFKVVVVPKILPYFKRQILYIPPHLRVETDIFHYLDSFGMVFDNHPLSVLTVHDIGMHLTHAFISKNWFKRVYIELLFALRVRLVSNYCVVSNSIKNDLSNYLIKHSIPSNSVEMIYHGADHVLVKKSKKNKPKKFFIAFGDFAWRKNVKVVLKAYSCLAQKTKDEFSLKLVISSQAFVEPLRELVDRLSLSENVDLVVEASNDKLSDLFSQAVALIYPSLYEGFGLPVIEAMRLGCPVITSNKGALAEVSGGAALKVNPNDYRKIAAYLILLTESQTLRKFLIKSGKNRSDVFTWKKTAQQVLQMYESMYAKRAQV